ncbi:hypothetical protein D3C83_190790 [compost metagenome]
MNKGVGLTDVLPLHQSRLEGVPRVARHEHFAGSGAIRRELRIGDREEPEGAALEHQPLRVDEARTRAP